MSKKYKSVRLRESVHMKLSKISDETGIVHWKIIDDALELYEENRERKRKILEQHLGKTYG